MKCKTNVKSKMENGMVIIQKLWIDEKSNLETIWFAVIE